MKKYILIFNIVLLLYGCGEKKDKVEKELKEKSIVIYEVKDKIIQKEVVLDGEVEPLKEVDIVTKTGGEILEINFKNGDDIKSNDIVVKLSNEEVESRYFKAKANLEEVKSILDRVKKFSELEVKRNYEESRANLVQKEKDLSAANRLLKEATVNYESNKKLYNEELISQLEFLKLESVYEKARSTYEALIEGGIEDAKRKYELARYKVEEEEWKYTIAEAKAKYDLILAEYRAAKKNYEDLNMTGKIDGSIAKLDLNLHEELEENTRVFKVIDVDTIKIMTSIGAEDIIPIKIGDSVRVVIDNLGEEYIGVIYEISPLADSDTKKFPIKIKLKNKDKALKAGMYSKVILQGRRSKGIVIPKKSLIIRELKSYIFIERNGKAYMIPVVTGIRYEEMIEVVEGDIERGDKVVVEGQYLLSDGDKVREVE